MKQQVEKLLSLKIEEKQLAICEITGIAISVNIPSLEGYAMEYTNPLASSKNFLPISQLSSKELLKFEPVILSGILLAVLKHHSLIESPLSSAQQNIYLQEVFPPLLVQSIKFFSSCHLHTSKVIREIFPHESLSPKIDTIGKSTPTDVLKNYYQACHSILFTIQTSPIPSTITNELKTIQSINDIKKKEAVIRANRSREAAQKELMTRGRKLVTELAKMEILSDNLIKLLRVVFKEFTLLSVEQNIRTRICIALAKHQVIEAKELIAIISDKDAVSIKDSIFVQSADEQIAEDIRKAERDELPKLSIREILAAKLSGNKNEQVEARSAQAARGTIPLEEQEVVEETFEEDELAEGENEEESYYDEE
jgi:hypothetical protein